MAEDSGNRDVDGVTNGGDEPVDNQTNGQIEDDVRSPRRSKKPVVVAGLAAALVVGVAAVFFVRANLDDSPDTTMVNGHEVLPTITGHDPEEDFLLELTDEGLENVLKRRDYGADLEEFVAVFVDDEFTTQSWVSVSREVDGLKISSWEEPDANLSMNPRLREEVDDYSLPIKGESLKWGIYETYYVVQYVDEEGEDLETPLVQPYELDIDVLDPVDSFEVSDPDEEGNVEFSWDPVDGADSYLIVSRTYSPDPDPHYGRTNYRVVDKASDTGWASRDTQTSAYVEEAELSPEKVRQNHGFEGFTTDPDIYQVGVIATDGQRFSHFKPQDVTDDLGSLPQRNNDDQWAERVGDPFQVDSLDELHDVALPYVTLDGSVEDTVMQVDPDDEIHTTWTGWNQSEEFKEVVRKEKERHRVPVEGVGTMLGREIQVEMTGDDIEDQVEDFNEAQLKLAEELGISTD